MSWLFGKKKTNEKVKEESKPQVDYAEVKGRIEKQITFTDGSISKYEKQIIDVKGQAKAALKNNEK